MPKRYSVWKGGKSRYKSKAYRRYVQWFVEVEIPRLLTADDNQDIKGMFFVAGRRTGKSWLASQVLYHRFTTSRYSRHRRDWGVPRDWVSEPAKLEQSYKLLNTFFNPEQQSVTP